jgi:hypothetical protein
MVKNIDSYIYAYTNNSTGPDYVIANITDLNTMERKVVCLESLSLINVYEDEISTIESYDSLIKHSKLPLSINLRKKQNLKNIGFYQYNADTLEFYKTFVTDSVLDLIRKNYSPNQNELLREYITPNIYIIHHLFNNEIICSRDCESGYIIIGDVIK